MARGVEDFVFELLTNVFNAKDTAPLALDGILQAGSFDLGQKAERMEDPKEWTEDLIHEKGRALHSPKGPAGDFED
jgi:hypothetical protein